jgi:hypothetical protein
MNRPAIGWLAALGVGVALAGATVLAQTANPDSHVAAAKAAIGGAESNVLFTRLCVPPAPAAPAAQPAQAQPAPQGPPPRASWYAEPAKVFDNLYRANADVLLSNHPNYDGTTQHLKTLASRNPGQPHPYVIGADRVRRFLTVAEECAQAGRARVTS